MGKTRDLVKKIIPREHFMQRWTQKVLRRGGKNTQKNCTKKIFMNQIT